MPINILCLLFVWPGLWQYVSLAATGLRIRERGSQNGTPMESQGWTENGRPAWLSYPYCATTEKLRSTLGQLPGVGMEVPLSES